MMMLPTCRRRHDRSAAAHFLVLSSLLLMMMMSSTTTAFLTSSGGSISLQQRQRVASAASSSSSFTSLQNAYIDESSFPLHNNRHSPSPSASTTTANKQQSSSRRRPPKVHPQSGGQITLVGSGPGSPSLLTLAAHSLITDPSNYIIVDRLVSDEILQVMDNAGVEYRIANKKPGCQQVAQDEIMEWCKEGLRQGRHVVRLKIGDPFVFGRGGEEVLEFREFGIEPTVIPGVSAAFSAPLLASIPVTHRGISNQVVMCTGYGKNNTCPDLIQYHPEQTVVFLMAVGRLRNLCDSLIQKANYPKDTPVGIVERAGCPEQRTVVGNLMSIADLAERYDVKPPSTIVVGEVVNVLLTEEDFVWDDEVDADNYDEREEMGNMMRRGYHGLVQSVYSSSS